MRVLFTSSGRRVELIKLFKQEGYFTIAGDFDPTAPSLYIADAGIILPKITEDNYISFLLEECKKKKVNILIPLIDTELSILAKVKDKFKEIGTTILISNYSSVSIAADKYATYEFFTKVRLPTPRTLLLNTNKELVLTSEIAYPVILKPRYGSSGKGVFCCKDEKSLRFFTNYVQEEEYILQELIRGEEITIDILGDGKGNVISAVQRKRLKVRGGEVERGVTIKYPELFEDVIKFSKAFKPFGAINIQCFYNKDNKTRFYTEINARFGGGYPLSYHAGANFPRYIKRLLMEEKINLNIGEDYIEGLIMSRFDFAIYKMNIELLGHENSF